MKVYYSPTDTQVSVLKNIKIYIRLVPTYFGAVTPSSGSVFFVLAKVGTYCNAVTGQVAGLPPGFHQADLRGG
jgi:hypothetical protein